MTTTERVRPSRSGRRQRLVGASLVAAGLLLAALWVPVHLLAGGFAAVDAPSFREALDLGRASGASSTVLLVLSATYLTTGAGVLRGGWGRGALPVVVAVHAAVVVALVATGAWLLGLPCAVAAGVLLVLDRWSAPAAESR